MLDFLFGPLRSALGSAEREMAAPLLGPEHDIALGVGAIHRATESIERHVEVIEGLATSVGPLAESVNQLTATMADLVALLAPLAKTEHEVERVEHFLGFQRHPKPPAEPGPGPAGA